MKAVTYMILLPVILGIWMSGCETIQQVLDTKKPTASLTGLGFDDVSLESATLIFNVEIDNPYPVALPLTNMDYGLSTGGSPFLSGSAAVAGTVPAESKKIVSLPAKINYMDMLKALKGVRPGTKIPYKADIGLSVDTPALGVLKLPLKKEGELDLPRLSEIDTADIWNIIKGN
jgi:LEA14-like dessication related protein